MIRNITKEFAHFLKEEKAYSNFIVNVKNEKLQKKIPSAFYFDWKETKQGFEYWYNLYSNFFFKIQTDMLSKADKN
jgi:hypothetical protein